MHWRWRAAPPRFHRSSFCLCGVREARAKGEETGDGLRQQERDLVRVRRPHGGRPRWPRADVIGAGQSPERVLSRSAGDCQGLGHGAVEVRAALDSKSHTVLTTYTSAPCGALASMCLRGKRAKGGKLVTSCVRRSSDAGMRLPLPPRPATGTPGAGLGRFETQWQVVSMTENRRGRGLEGARDSRDRDRGRESLGGGAHGEVDE